MQMLPPNAQTRFDKMWKSTKTTDKQKWFCPMVPTGASEMLLLATCPNCIHKTNQLRKANKSNGPKSPEPLMVTAARALI